MRKLRLRGLGTGMLILVLAALLGLNLGLTAMEKRHGWRMDFSFNGITTQSEATRKALAELTHPVHIYALFTKGQEDAPLMELLDRYAAESELVTWEQADPALNPALLTRFSGGTDSVSSDSMIVYCGETDRWRILEPTEFISLSMDQETGNYTYAGYTYERAITGAILYVTREQIPVITVIQGHGELDGESVSAFDALMTENHYEVRYQDLSASDYEPNPAELLVFFSPLRDLSDAEMEKITRFTDQGGSLLMTCDYTDPISDMPNYAALLRSYGFIPKDGIVVADREDGDSYYNQIRIDLIPVMKTTDLTANLVASGADTVLMPGCRAFETPGETDRNLTVMTVLESGETAYLKQLRTDMTSVEREEGDETGPFALALQARRTTQGGYISRAFVCGCSGMMTEEQIYAMTDTRQLMIRVAEFLTGQQGSNLEIMARSAIRPGLSVRSNGMGSMLVTALPLAVVLAAAVVLFRRRNM